MQHACRHPKEKPEGPFLREALQHEAEGQTANSSVPAPSR
eukprot:CAMPEP_0179140820 /NCGR_PEP_ID=MMETSP0796-20121207/67473_1 /TAXON_ID=73915 /ORGANISM="Pyrodinium bahamense, Strain pbaha01" /LENGTH=39 /DNA_ID= /DNA_START= /DNA_END= /DNA_ORIENTATION=